MAFHRIGPVAPTMHHNRTPSRDWWLPSSRYSCATLIECAPCAADEARCIAQAHRQYRQETEQDIWRARYHLPSKWLRLAPYTASSDDMHRQEALRIHPSSAAMDLAQQVPICEPSGTPGRRAAPVHGSRQMFLEVAQDHQLLTKIRKSSPVPGYW